jgi:hypothetical protein
MSKLRYLLPGLVAALALIGCGETKTVTEEPASADLCVLRQIDCHDPTGQISCDPVDGVCKCGGQWKNGVTCGDREVCKIDTSVSPPSPTCVSQACDGKLCGHDEACDARDGECKCAGVKCGPDETCTPASVNRAIPARASCAARARPATRTSGPASAVTRSARSASLAAWASTTRATASARCALA